MIDFVKRIWLNPAIFFLWTLLRVMVYPMDLVAEGTDVTVSADKAEYDGGTLSLQGHVVVETLLGSIKADSAILKEEEKPQAMRQIVLQDNVAIHFANHGTLSCAKADVDLISSGGVFLSSPSQEFVIYCEEMPQQGKSPLLVIKSREMTFEMGKSQGKRVVGTLVASRDLTIDYKDLLHISADQGVYNQCGDSSSPSPRIMLSPMEGGQCQVTTPQGDFLSAKRILFDIEKNNLSFITPKGTLMQLSASGRDGLDVACDFMCWDNAKGTLTMEGNISLDQPGLGTLQNNEAVLIQQHTVDGHQKLKTIQISGETLFSYVDEATKASHQLTCYGIVKADDEIRQVIFESPRDHAEVIPEKQLFFRDRSGEFYADDAVVDYIIDADQKIVLNNIRLKGNVGVKKELLHIRKMRGSFFNTF